MNLWTTVAAQADSLPITYTGTTTEAAPAVRQHCDPGPDRYEGAAMPDVTPLTGSSAAHLDACDRCLINTEVPYGGFTTPSGSLVCMYRCSDCGYRWHTSWRDSWDDGSVA